MQVLEPITVADARAFLSLPVTDTQEDALLELLISGARAQAENYIRRRIAQQEVWDRVIANRTGRHDSVDGITMLTEVLLNGTDITSECSVNGHGWLVYPPSVGILDIQYTTEEYCPPDVRNALLMMVRNSYTDRSADPLSEEVKGILEKHRVMRV